MLSVIIVNYKTPQLVLQCLGSFMQDAPKDEIEVFVVDNDSRDDSQQLIAEQFPEVQWMQMGYNAGFARANNAAMRIARGDCFLLLNSDTVVLDGALHRCYDSFISSPYVACGVQLLNADHSPQISGNYFVKGNLNLLLSIPYIKTLIRWLGEAFGAKKPNVPDSNDLVEVDWINGAFLMVRRTAADRAGLMDEDFFLYAEEAEWCYRLRKEGRMCIYGQYKVLHLQGGSAKTAFNSFDEGYSNVFDKKGLQFLLSNFLRVRKQHGKSWLVFHLTAFTCCIPVVFIGAALSYLGPEKRRLSLDRAAGFARNVLASWSYLPKMISGRPFFFKV